MLSTVRAGLLSLYQVNEQIRSRKIAEAKPIIEFIDVKSNECKIYIRLLIGNRREGTADG